MKTAVKMVLTIILVLALPTYAQESPADEEISEESTAEPATEEAIATTPVPEATAEPTETIALDEPAEEEPSENSDPLPIYLGLDLAKTVLSVSSLNGFDNRDYDSGLYRLRAGVRLQEQVSFEFHYGFDASDDGSGDVSTKNYYGLFAVPTANLFETVELAFPVGYAVSKVERPGASENLSSIAYGINAELPMRNFGDTWPDLRFGLGWMIYYQKDDARLYGANLGVRYDFTTQGFAKPFAGLANLDWWPFGDDDEQTDSDN